MDTLKERSCQMAEAGKLSIIQNRWCKKVYRREKK